jgi:hypothetical protein
MKRRTRLPTWKLPRPGRSFILHAAVLLAGLVCAFGPTLFSGGTRVQGDPRDTLLNHYVVEHS